MIGCCLFTVSYNYIFGKWEEADFSTFGCHLIEAVILQIRSKMRFLAPNNLFWIFLQSKPHSSLSLSVHAKTPPEIQSLGRSFTLATWPFTILTFPVAKSIAPFFSSNGYKSKLCPNYGTTSTNTISLTFLQWHTGCRSSRLSFT